MHIKIQNQLKNISEVKYKEFSLKLLPPDTKLLGVRIPLLKKMAKEIIKNKSSSDYLATSFKDLTYQEERMLYSLIIAYEENSDDEKIEKIKHYVSNIKNWSECDTFSAALKSINKNKEKYYSAFVSYTKSPQEYEVRFFYVIALNYYIEDTYLPDILKRITTQQFQGYYDRMAVAWFLSMAFAKYQDIITDFLKKTPLDDLVYKKTLSKINDSYQINKEVKQALKQYLTS